MPASTRPAARAALDGIDPDNPATLIAPPAGITAADLDLGFAALSGSAPAGSRDGFAAAVLDRLTNIRLIFALVGHEPNRELLACDFARRESR